MLHRWRCPRRQSRAPVDGRVEGLWILLIHIRENLVKFRGVLRLRLMPTTAFGVRLRFRSEGIEDHLLLRLQIRIPSVPHIILLIRVLLHHYLLLHHLQVLLRIHRVWR